MLCNNVLLDAFRIDPSTLYIDRHFSVTLLRSLFQLDNIGSISKIKQCCESRLLHVGHCHGCARRRAYLLTREVSSFILMDRFSKLLRLGKHSLLKEGFSLLTTIF